MTSGHDTAACPVFAGVRQLLDEPGHVTRAELTALLAAHPTPPAPPPTADPVVTAVEETV